MKFVILGGIGEVLGAVVAWLLRGIELAGMKLEWLLVVEGQSVIGRCCFRSRSSSNHSSRNVHCHRPRSFTWEIASTTIFSQRCAPVWWPPSFVAGLGVISINMTRTFRTLRYISQGFTSYQPHSIRTTTIRQATLDLQAVAHPGEEETVP